MKILDATGRRAPCADCGCPWSPDHWDNVPGAHGIIGDGTAIGEHGKPIYICWDCWWSAPVDYEPDYEAPDQGDWEDTWRQTTR